MKSIYQNTVKAGLLGAAVLLGFTACTDDHFDIQPSTVSGSNTIWQNVEANADLDSVAMILRRCKVMKSQTDKSAKQTYAELLATSQQLTAWLPKNGTFNAKQYLDELDSAAVLRAKDEMAGTRAEYDVANRFARNHIARFNYESNMGEQRIALMNSKIVNYNAGEGTFNGVKLDAANANILSSNGMLHVLDGESQFAYNIFERLQVDSRFAKIYGDIDKYNVYTFSASSSTQGSMNHNGSMEYVDSVWSRTNSLISDARLNDLTDEDSLFVSVIPTDAAYEAARQKLQGLFKYAKSYNYAWDESKRDWTNKGTNALKFNTDSLTTYNVTDRILSASSFSVGYNSEGPVTTSNPQAFLNHVLTADSLNTNVGLVIYNKDKGNVNPIFDGQTADDAIKASNGYIFAVDNYNYDPSYSFIQKININGLNTAQVTGSTSEQAQYVTLDNENQNAEVNVDALGVDNFYYYFPVSGNSQLNIDFKLNRVISTKYKISIVLLPNRVNINNIRAEEDGTIIEEKPVFDVQIRDDKGSVIGKAVKNVSVDQNKVEKKVLWEAFEFPYAYYGLPSGYESFPVLRISMSYAQQRKGKCKALSIAKVILEPVR
jgi:lipoprotein